MRSNKNLNNIHKSLMDIIKIINAIAIEIYPPITLEIKSDSVSPSCIFMFLTVLDIKDGTFSSFIIAPTSSPDKIGLFKASLFLNMPFMPFATLLLSPNKEFNNKENFLQKSTASIKDTSPPTTFTILAIKPCRNPISVKNNIKITTIKSTTLPLATLPRTLFIKTPFKNCSIKNILCKYFYCFCIIFSFYVKHYIIMEQFTFALNNKITKNGIFSALEKLYPVHCPPVIVCIGTDGVAGDSLGPFIGTILKERKVNAYVYGNLNKPITAYEVPYLNSFLNEVHSDSKIIVIDSAVGDAEETGLIKITDSGIKPGLGAKKNLPLVGDISIIGIVAPKSKNATEQLKSTRLRLIYEMANVIADGIEEFIAYYWQTREERKKMFYGISKIKTVAK